MTKLLLQSILLASLMAGTSLNAQEPVSKIEDVKTVLKIITDDFFNAVKAEGETFAQWEATVEAARKTGAKPATVKLQDEMIERAGNSTSAMSLAVERSLVVSFVNNSVLQGLKAKQVADVQLADIEEMIALFKKFNEGILKLKAEFRKRLELYKETEKYLSPEQKPQLPRFPPPVPA